MDRNHAWSRAELIPTAGAGDTPEVAEATEAIADLAGRRRGQGCQPPAENRQAVERYAVDRACEYYGALGWNVADVGGAEPYDLRCRRGDTELHVEVKGTTGDGSAVLLTPNEVKHAREQYPDVALVIVSGISLTHGARGSHADLRVIEPWRINDGELAPVGYRYGVPFSAPV